MAIDFQPLDREEGREITKPSSIDFQPVEDNTPTIKSPKNLMAFKPMSKQEDKAYRQQQRTNILEGVPGFGQGFLNSLASMGNLATGGDLKFNFAPDTEAGKTGEAFGDIASYFSPRAAFKGVGAAQKISNALKDHPIASAIMRNIGSGAEAALFGASHAPEGEKALEAGKMGTIGSLVDFGVNSLTPKKHPILNALLRTGIGAAGGGIYGALGGGNPLTTAGVGAATMLGLPLLGKSLGISGGKPGLESLATLNEQQIKPIMEASRRLKTRITPAEASGDEYIGGLQGRYGRTEKASAEKTKIGMERYNEQKTAINELLDTIHDKSTPQAAKASQDKIDNLYKESLKWNLKPEVLEQFKKDPVIKSAFEKVKKDPAYQRKLAGIPENSYSYLNQVKRALDDMEGSAIEAGENTRAAEFREARTDLLAAMDKGVPKYGQARAEAQKAIIRKNIEKAMRKKELRGSDFYNTIIKNEHEFNNLVSSLKNVPEAQAKLRDMKATWKNLINLSKPGNKAFREETGLNQSRQFVNKMIDMWAEFVGEKRNLSALKFINSPQWDIEGFQELRKIKDDRKREEKLAEIMKRLFTSGVVTSQTTR